MFEGEAVGWEFVWAFRDVVKGVSACGLLEAGCGVAVDVVVDDDFADDVSFCGEGHRERLFPVKDEFIGGVAKCCSLDAEDV